MASIMSEPAVLFYVELLLDTIKQHPVLYDKTNPRYKEAEYKDPFYRALARLAEPTTVVGVMSSSAPSASLE